MPSTFSTSLRLELIGNGEQAANWGNTTNVNLGTLLEQAIAGTVSIVMPDSNLTLASNNGISDQARNAVIEFTGTLGATRDVIIPAVPKVYIFRNQTNQSLLIRAFTGSGVTIPAGLTATVYWRGGNVILASAFVAASTGIVYDSSGPLIPAGVILMWSGSIATIPSGWALCNGTSGTPNLTDRFIIGAGASYPAGSASGSTTTSTAGSHSHGGATQNHTLTTAQMPAHQHTGTTDGAGAHVHFYDNNVAGSYNGFNADGSSGINSSNANRATSAVGDHTHNFTTSFVGGNDAHSHGISSDGSHNHTLTPPYWALAFIMKL